MIDSVPDLRLLLPHSNFGSGSRVAQLPRRYVGSPPNQGQGLRYGVVAEICAATGLNRLTVLGGGPGIEAVEFFARVTLDKMRGLEDKFNVALARRLHPAHDWIDCDFDSYESLEAAFDGLRPHDAQLYLIDDLLGRVNDPRALLWFLRRLLQANPLSRAVLLNPDRPPGPALLPVMSHHFREWSGGEIKALLGAAGFGVSELRHKGSSLEHPSETVLEVRWDADHFERLLRAARLPPARMSYLLCSTEHSACRITGGIGSYAAHVIRGAPEGELGFLFAGDASQLPSNSKIFENWLLPRAFMSDADARGLLHRQRVSEMVQALVVLYPHVRMVEFQEYQALGLDTVLHKRAGRLPTTLITKTRCHGSQLYIEECMGRWCDDLAVCYEEKRAIEFSDVVSFPTRFLRDLYLSKGYLIREAQIEVLKYPFAFDPRPEEKKGPIDTLIFFGKRTEMKGFPLFMKALERALNDSSLPALKRLIVIGRKDPSTAHLDAALVKAAEQIEVIEFEGTSGQAREMIEKHAETGLCVMPYRGDNHPVSVLEAISVGCQILAARAGGIPEMIPEEFHDDVLHDYTAESLLAGLLKAAGMDASSRQRLVASLIQKTAEAYRDVRTFTPEAQRGDRSRARSTVGLVVPCYNTDLRYVVELVHSLNEQSHAIDHACFVDDGSAPGYAQALGELLAREFIFPFSVIKHERNLGLPAARNTGLAALETSYIINIDSDDVAKPNFVRDYAQYLDRNLDVIGVTSYLESFEEGRDYNDRANSHVIYRPLGDGFIPGQTANCLGHANSGFRRAGLVEIGGWDASDKTMWEDWALYLKLVVRGHVIGVLPYSNILYRVHVGSMARNYSLFPAMNRLARSTEGLPRFEAHRLQAAMRAAAEQKKEADALRARIVELEDRILSLERDASRDGLVSGDHTGSRSKLIKKPLKNFAKFSYLAVHKILANRSTP